MRVPLLLKHNPDDVIGTLETADNKIIANINVDRVHITKENVSNLFGNAGYRVLEVADIDGIEVLKTIEILEFSFG
jgi:hypothetical protein